MTLNEIRSSRYWVMSGNSVVKRLILKCATCQRLRGNVAEKIMANLPPDRKKEEPSFTQFGVDMLSPFEINERRTTLKYSCACSHTLCEGKTSFCMGLISRTLCRFLCFQLASLHSVSYFFFLYRSPFLSLCTVSNSISFNIDQVLSINPSANAFVFGEFNIHHKD